MFNLNKKICYNNYVVPVRYYAQGFFIERMEPERGVLPAILNPCDCLCWDNQSVPFGFFI